MLKFPDEVSAMCQALAAVDGVRFSVKMRLGWDQAFQWRDVMPHLASIHPTYITIHPRIGTQHYKGELLLEEFELFLQQSDFPVVFNGEIRTFLQVESFIEHHPQLAGVMVGRGLVAHPSIFNAERRTTDHYLRFHEELLQGRRSRLLGGDHQVLAHMKTLWDLFLPEADKRLRKAIIKSRTLEQYVLAAETCIRQTV